MRGKVAVLEKWGRLGFGSKCVELIRCLKRDYFTIIFHRLMVACTNVSRM